MMNRLLQKVFENRGYTQEYLDSIENRNHLLPTNIDTMCERLKDYHDSQDLIVLLTDFDMDGIMSGVLGFAGMAELGFNVALYLPDTHGYGFDTVDIDRILEDYPDVKAILTADVGVAANVAVKYAKEKGIECFITDHHQPKGSLPTDKEFCVDPMLDADKGDEYFDGICGAHVLYLILKYYAEHYASSTEVIDSIERLRVFAGIATVSDRMPLLYENRQIVRDAVSISKFIYNDGSRENVDLVQGSSVYRRAFQGLYVMFMAFYNAGKIRTPDNIDETFFGFYVAPAFNSIKRMTEDISYAYNVFFESSSVAEKSMDKILELTNARKDAVNIAYNEIDNSIQKYAPYIYFTNASGGIRGLLAQNIMSKTGLPTVVISEEDGRFVGSGRSPFWYTFLTNVNATDYAQVAGHESAFGISIDSEFELENLFTFLKLDVQKNMPSSDDLFAKPDLVISTYDASADSDIDTELFENFVEECEYYKPYGASFEEPYIELQFEPKEAIWSYLGSEKNHLRIVIPGGLVLVCFNQADMFPDGIDKDKMPNVTSVFGRLNINEYLGVRTIQFFGGLDEKELSQK